MQDSNNTNNNNNNSLAMRLAIALDLKARAKVASGDNPLEGQGLDDLAAGIGITKGADRIPARNMAAVVAEDADRKRANALKAQRAGKELTPEQRGALNRTNEDLIGHELESARFKSNKDGKDIKAARRMSQMRRRAQRKMEFDAIVVAPFTPSPERMEVAWMVVVHLLPIIEVIARGKSRWAARFLGSLAEDVPSVVAEQVALVLAKSDHDLHSLRKAAKEVAKQRRGVKLKPGEDKKAAKSRRRERGWLMTLVNNRTMSVLADLYMSDQNIRWTNIDILASVMASISGVGEDPMHNRFKADKAPSFLGTKFQTPGSIHPDVLSVAVSAAITDRGLDAMVDLMLESTREDGSVRWTQIAEQLFKAAPDGLGEHNWSLVVEATKGLKDPKMARRKAAIAYTRTQFAWLPRLIVDVVRSNDIHVVAYNQGHAIMANGFAWDYLAYHQEDADPLGERRSPLQAALVWPDASEAAKALDEVLTYFDSRDMVLAVSSL